MFSCSKSLLILLALVLIVECKKEYKAKLNGSNQRPDPVNTTATGTAKIVYKSKDNVTTIACTVKHDLPEIIGAHIHGPATTEDTAPPVFIFTIAEGEANSVIEETFTLLPEQEQILFEKLMYVNLHTVTHPNGEIRGQVVPDNHSDDDTTIIIVAVVVSSVALIALIAFVIFYKKRQSGGKEERNLIHSSRKSAPPERAGAGSYRRQENPDV